VSEIAGGLGVSLLDASRHALEQGLLAARPGRMLRGFLDLREDLAARAAELSAAAVLDDLVRRLEFPAYLEKAFPGEAAERLENVQALVSAAVEQEGEEGDPSLQGFLDRSVLVADADEVGVGPGVTLMTIHCAKGLEYSVVFLAGLEESLFPHARSVGTDEELEEERRLCYVAMTRARDRLILSHAAVRLVQGVPMPSRPSRFLDEIPAEALEEVTDLASPAGTAEIVWTARDRVGSSAARAAIRLRTASDPPAVEPEPDPGDGLPVGATVRHPQFGVGKIVEREGGGKHLKLTIHFRGQGQRKILPAYTRLERI